MKGDEKQEGRDDGDHDNDDDVDDNNDNDDDNPDDDDDDGDDDDDDEYDDRLPRQGNASASLQPRGGKPGRRGSLETAHDESGTAGRKRTLSEPKEKGHGDREKRGPGRPRRSEGDDPGPLPGAARRGPGKPPAEDQDGDEDGGRPLGQGDRRSAAAGKVFAGRAKSASHSLKSHEWSARDESLLIDLSSHGWSARKVSERAVFSRPFSLEEISARFAALLRDPRASSLAAARFAGLLARPYPPARVLSSGDAAADDAGAGVLAEGDLRQIEEGEAVAVMCGGGLPPPVDRADLNEAEHAVSYGVLQAGDGRAAALALVSGLHCEALMTGWSLVVGRDVPGARVGLDVSREAPEPSKVSRRQLLLRLVRGRPWKVVVENIGRAVVVVNGVRVGAGSRVPLGLSNSITFAGVTLAVTVNITLLESLAGAGVVHDDDVDL